MASDGGASFFGGGVMMPWWVWVLGGLVGGACGSILAIWRNRKDDARHRRQIMAMWDAEFPPGIWVGPGESVAVSFSVTSEEE